MIARRSSQALAEVVLCSGYPTQLALTGVLRLAGLQPLTADGGVSLAFVAVLSAADTVLLLGLIGWLLARGGESPAAVLLGDRRQAREVGLGVALAPPLLVCIPLAVWALRAAWPALGNVPENPLERLATTPARALVLLAVAMIAGGVREEVQRAFLLHRFRADLGGASRGVVLTSIAFGLGHVVQGWDAVIVTALLGAFWAVLYLRRGSLTAGMTSHALINGTQIVVAFVRG
jgi:membrane protease YdiL (CAAX protease family)